MSSSAAWAASVKLNSEDWLNMRLGGKQLGDDQMWKLAGFTDDLLKSESGRMLWAMVDLSENMISSSGLKVLIDVLEKHKVQVKILKLYKNRITDEGGVRIADLIKRQEEPLEELHLSHNQLTGVAMVKLCLSIGLHTCQAYPYFGKANAYVPCWVRLEYNNVGNPMLCLELLRKEAQVKICLADNRDDCGPWRCSCMGKTTKGVPSVHLFSIQCQGRMNRAPAPQETESGLRDLIRKSGGGAPVRAARPATCLPVGASAPSLSEQRSGAVTPNAWANGSPVASAWGGNTTPTGSAWGTSLPKPAASTVPAAPEVVQPKPAAQDGSQKSAWGNADVSASWGYPEKVENKTKVASPVAEPVASVTPAADVESADLSQNRFVADSTKDQQRVAERAGQVAVAEPTAKGKKASSGVAKAEAPAVKEAVVSPTCTNADSELGAGTAQHRIYSEQLVVENDSFLCPLCNFIAPHPAITICSHIFCQTCFDAHVEKQLAAGKRNGVPCPHPACGKVLKKTDVTSLDASGATQNGAVHTILRRLRSNQMVRCKHHSHHFTKSFGKDAFRVKDVVTCDYVGDLTAIEKHLEQDCPVQKHLDQMNRPAEVVHPGSAAAPLRNGASGGQVAAQKREAKSEGKKKQTKAEKQAAQPKVEVADAKSAAVEMPPVESLFRCIFDFDPSGESQLQLRVGELLLVYESSETGWAAGSKVNEKTGETFGEAGWFPRGYLAPVAA